MTQQLCPPLWIRMVTFFVEVDYSGRGTQATVSLSVAVAVSMS